MAARVAPPRWRGRAGKKGAPTELFWAWNFAELRRRRHSKRGCLLAATCRVCFPLSLKMAFDVSLASWSGLEWCGWKGNPHPAPWNPTTWSLPGYSYLVIHERCGHGWVGDLLRQNFKIHLPRKAACVFPARKAANLSQVAEGSRL